MLDDVGQCLLFAEHLAVVPDPVAGALLVAVVAIAGAVLAWIGGTTTTPSSVFALLCGVFALTYPVFAWLDVLQAPLQRQLFLGS